LEKHWRDVFNYGYVVLDSGAKVPIPRYYEKWLRENEPDHWQTYVTEIKLPHIAAAEEKEKHEKNMEWLNNHHRLDQGKPLAITKHKIRSKITEAKFKKLQQHLKGDL